SELKQLPQILQGKLRPTEAERNTLFIEMPRWGTALPRATRKVFIEDRTGGPSLLDVPQGAGQPAQPGAVQHGHPGGEEPQRERVWRCWFLYFRHRPPRSLS